MSRTDQKDLIGPFKIGSSRRACPQPNVEIIGDADRHDSPTDQPVWRIRRISTVAGVETTEYADYAKFNQIWDDYATIFPAVPVEPSNKSDMEVTIVGGFGANNQGRVREVVVSDSWTPLAVTPFTRSAIAIQHEDVANPVRVKINWPPDTITPVGWVGMKLDFGEERYYDIKDSVVAYARVDDGAGNVTLWVEELD